MGPTWGRQDPGGPHVGPMNLVSWEGYSFSGFPHVAHTQVTSNLDMWKFQFDKSFKVFMDNLKLHLDYRVSYFLMPSCMRQFPMGPTHTQCGQMVSVGHSVLLRSFVSRYSWQSRCIDVQADSGWVWIRPVLDGCCLWRHDLWLASICDCGTICDRFVYWI